MSSSRTISFTLPVREETNQGWQVTSTVSVDQQQYPLWFRSSQGPIADGVETFLASCVVPAMSLGCALQSPAPVSPKLLQGIARFQDILHGWYPDLKQVPILAEAKATSPGEAAGVGSFFSCGVDATFTLIKHYEEITDTVLILGFDFHRVHTSSCEAITRIARQASQRMNRRLIVIDTNIRDLADPYTRWGAAHHGSVLGSIALLLSPQLSTMYIPSSFYEADLFPWGSHPAIDPLWSSEAVSIHHDGCETSRVQKTARIAKHDMALANLRVCWNTFTRKSQSINCGNCEKCLRTMIDLRIAGALKRCPTFQTSLNLSDLRLADLRKGNHRIYFQSSLDELNKTGHDPELASALRECLSGRHYRGVEGACRDVFQQNKGLIRPLMRPFERTARWLRRSFQEQT